MKKQIIILGIISLIAGGCGSKELKITPITGSRNVEPNSHVYHIGNDEFQYYTIANYKHIAHDSLYKELNIYIHSEYPYEMTGNNGLFTAFFYKKSLFVNYQKHISDAIRSEFGSIYGHNDNLIAKIYCIERKDDQYPVFTTVLYDKDIILLAKSDTIK